MGNNLFTNQTQDVNFSEIMNSNNENDPNKSINILNQIKKINPYIHNKREKELYDCLVSNAPYRSIIKKTKINSSLKSSTSILTLISLFEPNIECVSNLIIISSDTFMVLTKCIFNDKKNEYAKILTLPDLNKEFKLYKYFESGIDIFNYIIENDEEKSMISLIKLINEELPFDTSINIDIKINTNYDEKYILDHKEDKLIGLSKIEILEISNYTPGTPVIIKNEDILYLVGIVDIDKHYHIFNREELEDIKKYIYRTDMKYKQCQIEKINLMNKSIFNNDLLYVFQYNFINLKYLNLENNNLNKDGLIVLRSKTLRKLEYLNISHNKITDEGLEYLDELYNLKQLILIDMNLSNNYFLVLEKNFSVNKIQVIECDKEKLKLSKISENFNDFKLKNLAYLQFVNCFYKIQYYLKILFSLDNICSVLKELDLSNNKLTDNGMLRIYKNISKLKRIETINLENTELTLMSKKYIKHINNLNIKTVLSHKKLEHKIKKYYDIFLGGNSLSGKSTYFIYCSQNKYFKINSTTDGFDFTVVHSSLDKNKRYKLWDTPSWTQSKFNILFPCYIKNADGICLMFDASSKKDFENLNQCLDEVKNYLELDDIPILLIANKVDLINEKIVSKKEIDKFIKENKLVGYFEISCVNGYNVSESLDFIIDHVNKVQKQIEINNKYE